MTLDEAIEFIVAKTELLAAHAGDPQPREFMLGSNLRPIPFPCGSGRSFHRDQEFPSNCFVTEPGIVRSRTAILAGIFDSSLELGQGASRRSHFAT
jgi:hypothetical protein